MGEHHQITGPARGEPLPADETGARVRVPLDAAPSPRWSQAFAGHLATGLTGHPAVGHLRLDGVVHGAEIVLSGVEAPEVELLGPVLRSAVDAANRSCREESSAPPNMPRREAERLARGVTESIGIDDST